jgi:hypothetical protein
MAWHLLAPGTDTGYEVTELDTGAKNFELADGASPA